MIQSQFPPAFPFPLRGDIGDALVWDAELRQFVPTSGALLQLLADDEYATVTTHNWSRHARARIVAIDANAGGSSGNSGSASAGGASGAGGMRARLILPAYAMPASASIVIAAAAPGGSSGSPNDASAGADLIIPGVLRLKGGGVNAVSGVGQSYSWALTVSSPTIPGGGGSASGAQDGLRGSMFAAAGGGAGSNVTTSAGRAGGDGSWDADWTQRGGGPAGGVGDFGGAGANGVNPGDGGGGGGGNTTGVGGNGGNGFRGGGGGGGGRGTSGISSGGDGGLAYARIIQYG